MAKKNYEQRYEITIKNQYLKVKYEGNSEKKIKK